MASEDELVQRLQDLQKQLGKRQTFEEALSSIKSLLRDHYTSSSPSTQKVFYTAISRVATVLRTRYTASSPGYLLSGLELFEAAERLTADASEKSHYRTCIRNIREELNRPDDSSSAPLSSGRRGYLFEGHLTVDPEPPQPAWLAQQNLLTALAAQAESQGGDRNGAGGVEESIESVGTLLRGLIESLDTAIPQEILDAVGSDVRGAPPASKEVVAKLPVVTVDEGVLGRMGEGAECAICKEGLVVGDAMQEMPCKHTFHPPCLKPWLDEHNSCPICRHELPTDDHAYEARKEREKELEEERRGAANAVRGGEFMYV